LQYFINTHGARKGLSDTALKTAEAGYLTRRLVDAVQDVVIKEPDCGFALPQTITREQSETIGEKFEKRVFGRTLAEPIVHPKTGEIVAKGDIEIDNQVIKDIEELQISAVNVRSIMACKTENGICQKCYGRDLATNKTVELGMAVGIIFIFITPGYAPNLMSFLFGSILTVTAFDIYLLLILNIIVILFFFLLFKEILFVAFDEEYAKTQMIATRTINYILLLLVALTIVINIRVAGIILVISLLTIPQATATLFSKNFKNIIFLSILFGFIASIGGLFLSYNLNIPSGASIIFLSVIIFTVLKLITMLLSQLRLGKILN